MEYRGFTLDDFQADAITHLDAGRSVLVTAPTGTGKTIIADRVVEKALEDGKCVIYTAPVKALSNQKFRDYCRLHGEQNVGLVTGDLVVRRDAPCLVMTTEILRNILLSDEPLTNIQAVILDEIHFLDDPDRGTVWEEVLIYLPSTIQILGLSATLSNVDEFSAWLGAVRGQVVEVVSETQRSVPLELLIGDRDGLFSPPEYNVRWKKWFANQKSSGGHSRRGGRGDSRGRNGGKGRHGGRGRQGHDRVKPTRHTDIFKQLHPDLTPYIYFVFSRRHAEELARGLGRTLEYSLLKGEQKARMKERLRLATEDIGVDVLDDQLYDLYSKGIAFHHAGIHVQLKALVESLYEDRLIEVLYTTSTFALGINMPARTVVLDGLHKFDGRSTRPLRVREFLQKAGRAGRRGLDDEGFVVVKMDKGAWYESGQLVHGYELANPERVNSSFGLSFNSIVNLVKRHDSDHIKALLNRSFLSWHLEKRSNVLLEKAESLQEKLNSEGWEQGERAPKGMNGLVKEMKRLRKRSTQGTNRVWADFELRKNFLIEHGYLNNDDSFNSGAKVLQYIQISEIFTTELVLSGLLEEIDSDHLFGIFCAMTNSLPKRVQLTHKLNGEARRIAKLVNNVRYSTAVTEAERITGSEVDWDPNLIQFGRGWAEGRSLVELELLYHSDTDISGQLIRGFRRAKDLATQLREVHKEDPFTLEKLNELIARVKRDEVEVID